MLKILTPTSGSGCACAYNVRVNQILSEPEHKAANILYITMNVCGFLVVLLSVILVTAFLTAMDAAPFPPFARTLMAASLVVCPLFMGLALCAFAQILRYVVCIYARP
jgi:hypothetical protein